MSSLLAYPLALLSSVAILGSLALPANAQPTELPSILVGNWESVASNCGIAEDQATSGQLVTVTNPHPPKQQTPELFLTSHEGEGGDCKVQSWVPEGLGIRLDAQCRDEEGPYSNTSYRIELGATGEIMSLQSSGDTSTETYYRCPSISSNDRNANKIKDILSALEKNVRLGRDLLKACSNTYQSASKIPETELFKNITSCETALDIGIDYAFFIYELSGNSTEKLCYRKDEIRRDRLDSFISFLDRIGDLKQHSSASLIYTFATEYYKCVSIYGK